MPKLNLTANSVKCTVVVSPEQIAGYKIPNGSGPVAFDIDINGRHITGVFTDLQ